MTVVFPVIDRVASSPITSTVMGRLHPLFAALFQSTIVPERHKGSGTPTFTRATTATVEDFEGLIKPVLSGEVRFKGARRVQNLCSNPEDITNWTASIGGTGLSPTVTAGQADPLGGTDAFRVQLDLDGGTTNGDYAGIFSTNSANPSANGARRSVYIKAYDGVSTYTVSLVDASASAGDYIPVTGAWQRLTPTSLATVSAMAFSLRGTNGSGSVDILVWHPQLEDVTGQAITAPSEYVSVGTLAAPYHGANVDGVAYKLTHNANTVSSNVVTEETGAAINSNNSKFGVLDGTTGLKLSTTDSVTNSIVGDIDIRAKIAPNDWTPASQGVIVSKYDPPAFAYQFKLTAAGNLIMEWSSSGAVDGGYRGKTSTAATGFTDGTVHWVRATLDVDNGATGSDVNFYTSEDGVTWTQLGDTVTTAGVESIFDNGSPVTIGTNHAGSEPLAGKIYSAQIYDGIDGTLAVDFNANKFTTAQTATMDTGEVWTANGTARVFGSTHATYGIPAPWDASGPFGSLPEGARTNLALYSRTWQNAAWAATTMTVADNTAVGVDGLTRAATLTATGANSTLIQDLGVIASAVKGWGLWIKRKTGTGNIDLTLDGGATWTTKTITAGWTRIEITQTLADPDIGIRIVTSADAVYVDYGQCEAASFLSSTIPETTTAAVTRNLDLDSYASAGNISATAGTIFMEWTPIAAGMGTVFLFGTYVDASNYTAILHDGTNMVMRKRISGVNYDATKALTYVANTVYRIAGTWGSQVQVYVNDVAGTADSDTADAQIGSTIQILADGNGANSGFGSGRDTKIYPRELTANQVAGL